MNKNYLNVFKGKNSIIDFLNPDNNPPLPLVEIPEHLNPFKKNGVKIFAKMMNFLPLGNVKSLPAYNMLLSEKKSNKFKTIIENSSGNTVFSLAVIGRAFGIPTTKAIVSNQVKEGKLKLLRLLGTEIIVNREPICPDPEDKSSGIYKAKIWAKENNWLNPGQYDNENNPKSHKKWTAKQIWTQLSGKIDIFCAGLGTTGTMVGCSQFFKEKNKKITTIGVIRKPNNPVPGVRTKNLLKQIAFDWNKYTDHIEEVGTVDSFKKSLDLCRSGIMVGPSSGFAFAGLLNFLEEKIKNTNKKMNANCVFICPDSPTPYINEYFEYLKEEDFPKIENGHFLEEKNQIEKIKDDIPEIEPLKVFDIFFKEKPEIVWQKIKQNKKINHNKQIKIIDIRNQRDYEDFHIPGSENIETVINYKKIKAKKIIFVCKYGETSKLHTFKAKEQGIDAYSLKGGMLEWSKENFPRIRHSVCVEKFNLNKNS